MVSSKYLHKFILSKKTPLIPPSGVLEVLQAHAVLLLLNSHQHTYLLRNWLKSSVDNVVRSIGSTGCVGILILSQVNHASVSCWQSGHNLPTAPCFRCLLISLVGVRCTWKLPTTSVHNRSGGVKRFFICLHTLTGVYWFIWWVYKYIVLTSTVTVLYTWYDTLVQENKTTWHNQNTVQTPSIIHCGISPFCYNKYHFQAGYIKTSLHPPSS